MTTPDELLVWHGHREVGGEYATIDAFHEWNVEFAIEKFKAKKSNEEPIIFFNFRRYTGIGLGEISICETRYGSMREKYAVQQTMREACRLHHGIQMISSICEMWIATTQASPEGDDLMERYGEVRHIPGREDGLMVATFARDGGVRMTKWIVKLKANPANNRMLARDDVPMNDGTMYAGANFGFFEPERPTRPFAAFRAAQPQPKPDEPVVVVSKKEKEGNGYT